MTFPYPIVQTPAKPADFTYGRSEPVRAIVCHRMVGTLPGTDRTFQAGDANRAVSTTFGVGYDENGILEIHQYVALDDTAYGNGNYDPSGNWDNWGYKTTEINAQTISIEHQDNGASTNLAIKGIVPPDVQKASMALIALILRANPTEWKAAGIRIRDWANNAPILVREIKAIKLGPRTLINHNDIAGKLKPYCWKPWAADKVGFSYTLYAAGIAAINNPPAPTPVPVTYTQAQLDAAIAAATTPLKNNIQTLTAKIDAERKEALEVAAALTAAATRLSAA